MRKENARGRKIGRVISLIVTMMMVLVMAMPVMAEDSTLIATDDPRESVMLISLGYQDDGGRFYDFKWGTCFLINEEYVLTNKHVVTMTTEEFEEFKSVFNVPNLKPNDGHIKLYLYVNRDMRVAATMHESVHSDDMDFAAVKLSERIYDRKPVALGDSDLLQTKDKVYAMGYPVDSVSNKEYNTKDDVSTVEGSISKITTTGNVDIIEHTASLNNGNSGGPLLDEDNAVIGINSFISGRKNYSIQINAIKAALDTFGIAYPTGAGPVPDEKTIEDLENEVRNANAIDTANYTEDSVAALNKSIADAEAVIAKGDAADATEIEQAIFNLKDAASGLMQKETEEKEEDVDPSPDQAPKTNMTLIIIIAVVVVVLIIIIILVVVLSGNKKKNAPVQNPGPDRGPAPMVMPSTVPVHDSETALLNSGDDATTLLSGSGGDETTLLKGNAYLIRKKNGEKVMINLQNFKIGKKKDMVNYCVTDNPTISRLHCEIIRKGPDYYVVDQGSANNTYVNGVQIGAKKETLLTDCSLLKLSDEEFEFHLS